MSRRAVSISALPPVFTLADVRTAGGSQSWLRAALARHDVRRLQHDVYCTTETWDRFQRTTAGRHALECRVALAAMTGPAYVALESAAVLHRLPILRVPTHVQLVGPPDGPTRRRGGVVLDRARLPQPHLGTALQVPATSVARTVVDIARRRELAAALVTGDAALHTGRIREAALQRVVDDLAGTFGMAAARSAIALMDGRRESPLESQSIAAIVALGLPVPEPQVLIRTADGRVVARVDFLWRAHGVVGEVDGKVKYVATDPSALWREKRRQEAVEDAGFIVVRWGAFEIAAPGALDQRIRRAFALAARRRGAA